MFEKGHKGFGGGRKPGTRNRNKNALDIYKLPKVWKKTPLKSALDISKVDYYLYNGLDITELYDELKLYDYDWKDKEKGYNLNEKKRDDNKKGE